MTDEYLVGVCGIYCGGCLLYRAHKDKDEKLAEYLVSMGLSRDQLHCEGCISGDVSVTCTECVYRDCARKRGLTFCFECQDMPCEKIVELAEKRSRSDNLPHLTLCPANLKTLRQIGVEEWLKQQETRWTCTQCGKKMHWYSESCPHCRTGFFDATKEAQSLGKLQGWLPKDAPT